VLFYSYIVQGYNDAYHRELLGIGQGINYHQYVDGWVVIESTESTQFQAAFRQQLSDVGYIDFFLDQCEKASNNLFRFGSWLRTEDHASNSTAHLLMNFAEFSSLSIRLMPFLTTMVLVQDVLERDLRNRLSTLIGLPTDSPVLDQRMQSLLLSSERAPLATQSLRDLREIVELLASFPDICSEGNDSRSVYDAICRVTQHFPKLLKDYVSKYDFLGTDYYVGKPLDCLDVLNQALALVRAGKTDSDVSNDMSSESLPADISKAVTVAQRMHFLRQYRIEALFKSGCDARGLFNEIRARLGLSYEEFLALTFEEIYTSLFRNYVSIPLTIIHQRAEGYGVLMTPGSLEYVVGDKLDTLRKALHLPVNTDSRLQGTTAFPGSYKGPARVIDNLSDIDKVKPGDVLVAPMTSPYHVPAMTVAGAVVTSEGGILSHAAILCRELRIPCIVGVAQALERISNGDIVEVDARPSTGTISVLSLGTGNDYAH